MEREANADREVLAACDVRELAHEPSSRVAASPIGSGQLENPLPLMLVAGLSPKPCRGSDEIVTGIPSRAPSAASCIRLCHSASTVGPGPSRC